MQRRTGRGSANQSRDSRTRLRTSRQQDEFPIAESSSSRPRRRSARLAGLSSDLSQSQPSSTGAPGTNEVLRPHADQSAFSERSEHLDETDRALLRERRRTRDELIETTRNLTRLGNGIVNGIVNGECPFNMNIAVQPPREAHPGALLHPPIVVLLDSQRPQDADDPNVWGLISVVSADGLQALSPPHADLLSGTLVDSIHTASVDGGSRVQRFISFSNVRINREGNYRIRVCLVRMRSVQSEAVNMESIMTQIIRINGDASATTLGSEERRVLISLGVPTG